MEEGWEVRTCRRCRQQVLFDGVLEDQMAKEKGGRWVRAGVMYERHAAPEAEYLKTFW
jgi:hypothetical protein